MNKYSEILKSWEAPEGLTEDEALRKIEGRLSNEVKKDHSRMRTLWWSAASVAAAVVLAWLFLLPNNRVIREATEIAATKTVQLPDGSVAILNASSELTYAADWSDERNLELKGEAFFQVKKGSAFTVKTPNGSVTVLGTSFNVFSRDNALNVACNTGRVRVESGAERVELTPGQCAKREGAHLILSDFDNQAKTWREGLFYFENARLKDIVAEMERQFGIQIECEESVLEMAGITTNFSKDDRDAAFLTVGTPVGMEFVPINNTTFKLQKRP